MRNEVRRQILSYCKELTNMTDLTNLKESNYPVNINIEREKGGAWSVRSVRSVKYPPSTDEFSDTPRNGGVS